MSKTMAKACFMVALVLMGLWMHRWGYKDGYAAGSAVSVKQQRAQYEAGQIMGYTEGYEAGICYMGHLLPATSSTPAVATLQFDCNDVGK